MNRDTPHVIPVEPPSEAERAAMKPWTWTTDVIHEHDIETGVLTASVRVLSETPMTKDGQPMPRYGNRYYPTMVEVWTGYGRDGEHLTNTILSSDAAELGQALLDAARLADAVDALDSDVCGHWAPCDPDCRNRPSLLSRLMRRLGR